jgi:hypothetical protein
VGYFQYQIIQSLVFGSLFGTLYFNIVLPKKSYISSFGREIETFQTSNSPFLQDDFISLDNETLAKNTNLDLESSLPLLDTSNKDSKY